GEGRELQRAVHSLQRAAPSLGAAAPPKGAGALHTAVETRQYDHDPAAAADLAALFGRFSDAVAAHRHAPETP
ncbi:MAG: hypothetical protein ACK5U4_03285, partial [Rhodospirillales bacterium]